MKFHDVFFGAWIFEPVVMEGQGVCEGDTNQVPCVLYLVPVDGEIFSRDIQTIGITRGHTT